VLLVPGLGGVGSYWAPNLPAFSARHQAIVHDHRGTGAPQDRARASRRPLRERRSRPSIRKRLISLTIYASWTKCDPFFRRVFEARRALLTLGGAGAYTRAASVFLYPDWWINENIGLLEERERVVVPNFQPAEIVASRIDAIVAFDRTADLPNIRLPTLVICAKDDILTPPYFSRELARLIPNASRIELAHGGHCAFLVRSRSTAPAISSVRVTRRGRAGTFTKRSKAAGGSFKDITFNHIFLSDMAAYAAMNEVYRARQSHCRSMLRYEDSLGDFVKAAWRESAKIGETSSCRGATCRPEDALQREAS
jgi:aminoacrylate hydrolase